MRDSARTATAADLRAIAAAIETDPEQIARFKRRFPSARSVIVLADSETADTEDDTED